MIPQKIKRMIDSGDKGQIKFALTWAKENKNLEALEEAVKAKVLAEMFEISTLPITWTNTTIWNPTYPGIEYTSTGTGNPQNWGFSTTLAGTTFYNDITEGE